jgi:hypothetical protein
MHFFKILCFLFLFILSRWFCESKTDSFTILGIASNRPFNPAWETRPLSTEEKQVFRQKFIYFGKGAQVYVFFSEDGKYVLKFFRQKSYTPPFWISYLPEFLKYKDRKISEKKARFLRDFESYKLAFEKIPEETGTLYVHLNKTDHLHQKITLIDRLQIEHVLDLDQFDFVLQEKAEIVPKRIHTLMHEGKVDEAKAALSSILQMIGQRTHKGVIDRYPNLLKNFGFIGNRAVELDIGRFYPGTVQEGLERLKVEFKEWLSCYPELAAYWEENFSL